jgi:hypothetical protein
MNCYSRYFSLTDVRSEKVAEKPKFLRSTSLQDQPKSVCDNEPTAEGCEPFSFEEDNFEGFENKSTNEQKLPRTKCEGNTDESEPSTERKSCLLNKETEIYAKGFNSENGSLTDARVGNVYTTVTEKKQWCQCFKENTGTTKTSSLGTVETSQNSIKLKDMMGQLVEEIPTEIKCEKCHLEIEEESARRRKRVIELWMEFFGPRWAGNTIYRSASGV